MYVPPIKITIPLPVEQPRKRGRQSTTAGANFRIRCSPQEHALIHEEANILGITGSMFARVVAIKVALALQKHRQGGSTDDEEEYGMG